MKLKVGSRESRLAVIQSQLVIDKIRECSPETEIELITMKTTGDKILNKTLDKIGGKGLFVKELDMALLDGRSDISVHSLKDMPMEVPGGLPILAFSEREDVRDVLVLQKGLDRLPEKPIIGTSSKRRTLQAVVLYPDAEFKGIRGNIQKRLEKLDEGDCHALILAAAGLKRLGLNERISRYFSIDEIIPCAGQGVMAIQGRAEDHWEFAKKIDCMEARLLAEAERAFVTELNGGCTSPIAACAVMEEGKLFLRGLYMNEDTKNVQIGSLRGKPGAGIEIGKKLARQLKDQSKMTEENET